MDLTKPVELMSPEESNAYYVARRKALLAGDNGVLPSGKTCREEREEYEALCAAETQAREVIAAASIAAALTEEEAAVKPAMTTEPTAKPPAPKAKLASRLTESDLPSGIVAPELPSTETDSAPNKRCCG